MSPAVSVIHDGHVGTVTLHRPPDNFIDVPMAGELADRLAELDADPDCRCVVLASEGKHFCAGANLAGRLDQATPAAGHIYDHVERLLQLRKPLVAAIQGAAVGAGLGLALLADFRVVSPQARLSANFTRQGYHPGFGLTFTLPRLLGVQRSAWMFYSGERVSGEDALRHGLADRLAPLEGLHEAALEMAREIARSGPRAVVETRASLRGDFAEGFMRALRRERAIQDELRATEDYREGVLAMKERRLPRFHNR